MNTKDAENIVTAFEDFCEAKFDYLYYSKQEDSEGYKESAAEEYKMLERKRYELKLLILNI